jgi:hypothetical protein
MRQAEAAAPWVSRPYPAADPPAVEWTGIYGGSFEDGFLAVAATPDGGLAAAGHSASPDGDAEHNCGGLDGWLLKIGPEGDVEAKRSFGGSGRDRIGALAASSDGGYLVAGETEIPDWDFAASVSETASASATGPGTPGTGTGGSPADRTAVAGPSHALSGSPGGTTAAPSAVSPQIDGKGMRGRLWAAKVDSELRTVWMVVFGGDGEWSAEAVSERADGGFQVLGTGLPSPDPDPAAGNLHGSRKCQSVGRGRKFVRLETLDPSGRHVSSRCYVLPDGLESSGVSAVPGGGAVLAYSHTRLGGIGESGIAGFGNEAELVFDRNVPDVAGARPDGAAHVPGGGYAVAGSLVADGARPYPWLLMSGPDGAVRWQTSLDSEGLSGRLVDVAVVEGGIFAVGASESLGPGDNGGQDLLAVRTDPAGRILFSASWGGNGTDTASSCAVMADGGLVAAGETDSAEVGGTLAEVRRDRVMPDPNGLIVKFRP